MKSLQKALLNTKCIHDIQKNPKTETGGTWHLLTRNDISIDQLKQLNHLVKHHTVRHSFKRQPFWVKKKKESVTPQCVVAWNNQNKNYQAPPPPVNHNAWLQPRKAKQVSSDDKSISTITTQSDLIDNMNHKIQTLEKQISSLQKQVLTKQPSPPTPPPTNPTADPSPLLAALETKLANMMENQHNYFASLHQHSSQAITSLQSLKLLRELTN